jgi:hypothetical protein
MKPDHVFVAKRSTEQDGLWLLGDLGNVREIAHPYHMSRVWTHTNKQLPDCRANDALRATKTYLQFLRHASSSSGSTQSKFDQALLEAREPWARLFWRAHGVGNSLRTESVLEWSTGHEHPTTSASSYSTKSSSLARSWRTLLLLPLIGWQGIYKRSAASALKITASDGWARVLGLTWVLGVPVGKC